MLQNMMAKADATNAARSQETPQQQPPAKRAKTEIPSQKIYDMILTALMEIWKNIQANPSLDKNKIEIEARMGMLIHENQRWQSQVNLHNTIIVQDSHRSYLGIEFKAGVDQVFFMKHIKSKVLTPENEFKCISKTVTTNRSNSSSLRWEISNSGSVKMSESKDRFFRWNFAMLPHEYDIRFDAAVENQKNAIDSARIDYNNWTQQRVKHRSTFTNIRFPFWKVDVTEVHVTNKDNGQFENSIEYEVEVELENGHAAAWLHISTEEEAAKQAMNFADSLNNLIDFTIPSIYEELSHETPMELCRKEYIPEIMRLNGLILGTNDPHFEFIGSMPHNISRKNLSNIRSSEYYITEKSDGMRYLMYIVNDSQDCPIAIFMNRAKEVYKLQEPHRLGYYFKSGTVLDCEIVYNRTFKQQMILIFDILSLDGVSFINKPFSKRLEALDGEINNRCAEYLRNGHKLPPYSETTASTAPTSNTKLVKIIRKKYFPKHDIIQLLLKLRFEHGHRVYYDAEGRRHHETDGIIFQPNSRYVPFSDGLLLKWKWSDLRSVDLVAKPVKVQPSSSQQLNESGTVTIGHPSNRCYISLLCSGPDDTTIDCTKRGSGFVGLSVFDSYRLMANMNAITSTGPKIVEVMYDNDFGLWKYHRIRTDKSKPNYIDTVFGVLIEQAEDISIEELEYSLVADTTSRQDFQATMQDKLTRLINEVRYENKKKSKSSIF